MQLEQSPIWVTGAHGLIGNYLVQSAAAFVPGQRVVGLSRAQIDLTDFDAVRCVFREQAPRLLAAGFSLEQRAKKWTPVFRKNAAKTKGSRVDRDSIESRSTLALRCRLNNRGGDGTPAASDGWRMAWAE